MTDNPKHDAPTPATPKSSRSEDQDPLIELARLMQETSAVAQSSNEQAPEDKDKPETQTKSDAIAPSHSVAGVTEDDEPWEPWTADRAPDAPDAPAPLPAAGKDESPPFIRRETRDTPVSQARGETPHQPQATAAPSALENDPVSTLIDNLGVETRRVDAGGNTEAPGDAQTNIAAGGGTVSQPSNEKTSPKPMTTTRAPLPTPVEEPVSPTSRGALHRRVRLERFRPMAPPSTNATTAPNDGPPNDFSNAGDRASPMENASLDTPNPPHPAFTNDPTAFPTIRLSASVAADRTDAVVTPHEPEQARPYAPDIPAPEDAASHTADTADVSPSGESNIEADNTSKPNVLAGSPTPPAFLSTSTPAQNHRPDTFTTESANTQESEPPRTGVGVLPPHPAAEREAIGVTARSNRHRRGLAVAAAILCLVAFGAAGFLFLGITAPSDEGGGTVPIIMAEPGPLKVSPEPQSEPVDATVASAETIFRRVEGAPPETERERLILREEPKAPIASPAVDTPPTIDPRALEPRRVRTVVVRPDGTIVSEADPQAGASVVAGISAGVEPDLKDAPALANRNINASSGTIDANAPPSPASVGTFGGTAIPVIPSLSQTANDGSPPTPDETPQENANALDGAPVAASPENLSQQNESNGNPAQDAAVASANGVRTPGSITPETGPALDAAAAAQQGQDIVVLPRPKPPAPAVSSQANTPQTALAAAPSNAQETAAAPPTSVRPPAGGYAVQISSQRSEEQARATYRQLQTRFPELLGARDVIIERADLGAQGVFYRARVPTENRQAAISLCEQLKANGGDCFVRQN